MEHGYIKLHRQLQNNWLWQEKRIFSKAEAWIDLLMMVNHKEAKVLLGNEIISINKGSRVTSVRQLCDRWSWSNTKVKSFLETLRVDEMIVYKSDTKKTVVSVVNWDLYQCQDVAETSQKRHKNDTKTSQKHTNKNDKNDNNEKNDNIYSPDLFDEFWAKYPKKKSKGQAETTWNKIQPNDILFMEIMDGLERSIDSPEWKEKNGKFIPYPSTWLNAKGWEDEYEIPVEEESKYDNW